MSSLLFAYRARYQKQFSSRFCLMTSFLLPPLHILYTVLSLMVLQPNQRSFHLATCSKFSIHLIYTFPLSIIYACVNCPLICGILDLSCGALIPAFAGSVWLVKEEYTSLCQKRHDVEYIFVSFQYD